MIRCANPNATEKARELLSYLYEVAGRKIITGQHTQTKPMEEISYIKEVTGKAPKLYGFELLAYSPNINYEDASYECLKEVEENKGTLDTAMDLAEHEDVILTLTFHWYSPLYGRDKSFYQKNTEFDARRILIQGSEEKKAFYHDMEVIGEHLKRFRQADIPILWRPFHEADGDWFWWGSKGPEVARELYKLMFDYYVNELHLDNLLWVWNCPKREGYPGDDYVDVISVDVYNTFKFATDYERDYLNLIKETTKNKVCALAEVGYIPDIDQLKESQVPWAYYMCWSKEFCIGEQYNSKEDLKHMYESDYSITND
ncbi:MAG: glycoside hydrolase family 26 protein [Erysipelotrichaceae bacterium]|nr:glycoside hydrolase family 26 protein [Erysipelotrichaceae bacterium]